MSFSLKLNKKFIVFCWENKKLVKESIDVIYEFKWEGVIIKLIFMWSML